QCIPWGRYSPAYQQSTRIPSSRRLWSRTSRGYSAMRLASPVARISISMSFAYAVALMAGFTVSAPSAQGQTFTVLYSFKGGPDGNSPLAGVIRDAAGNLYSTTVVGGNLSCGG